MTPKRGRGQKTRDRAYGRIGWPPTMCSGDCAPPTLCLGRRLLIAEERARLCNPPSQLLGFVMGLARLEFVISKDVRNLGLRLNLWPNTWYYNIIGYYQ